MKRLKKFIFIKPDCYEPRHLSGCCGDCEVFSGQRSNL